jgi:predicted DNA-binding transcriptional regulator YafY
MPPVWCIQTISVIIGDNSDRIRHYLSAYCDEEETMSRTARLLELLIALQQRPRFTVQEMANDFGVSRRTMLRDLHDLSAMGVPLVATPGPGGGYGLIARQRLLPLSLTSDEAIGIILSYEALLSYAQLPFAAQSLSAITKLRVALPPDIVQELDRIRQYVVVLETERRYEAPLLPDLFRATLDGAHLRIVYDSRSGVSERTIYPFGLYAASGFWYCACYDDKRGINLSLRADRLNEATRVEGLKRPACPSLREWLEMREQHAERPLRLRATVTERGMKQFDFSALFGPSTTETRDGAIDTIIPEAEIDFFAARLLPLGTDIVVESPPQLIEAMRTKAEEIAALYRGNASTSDTGSNN